MEGEAGHEGMQDGKGKASRKGCTCTFLTAQKPTTPKPACLLGNKHDFRGCPKGREVAAEEGVVQLPLAPLHRPALYRVLCVVQRSTGEVVFLSESSPSSPPESKRPHPYSARSRARSSWLMHTPATTTAVAPGA